jgi:microcystin-dependent protein
MSSGFYTWSQTAALNASASDGVNYREGQSPSSLNDSARAAMSELAKYRDDNGSNLQTAGTSTVYTLATNQQFDSAAHMATASLSFFVHVTNGPNPTIQIDGLGPYPIVTDGNASPVPVGAMVAGGVYSGTFSNSASQFRLKDFYVNPFNVPLGGVMEYIGSTVPNSNFAFPLGQAISRTTYATLFALVGTTYGPGDGSTTFNVINMAGRVTAMKEAVATRLTSSYFGGDSTALGAVGGSESHLLTTAEIPSHSHTNTLFDPGHDHNANISTSGAGTSVTQGLNAGSPVHGPIVSNTTGITITNANTGGGTAHAIVQPTIIVNKILRII